MISSDDLARPHISRIFSIADNLSTNRESLSLKEKSTLALLFDEPSTRTRLSFEVAMIQLGGIAIYIDTKTSQIKRGETLADTAKIISSYCDFMAVRTNNHENVITIAKNSTDPVINALTELEHPTQALTDVYTITKRKGNMRNLKIAFLGDIAQNTANSLMLTATKLGAEIALVGPKGFRPNSLYYNKAREYSRVDTYESVEDGVDGADIIYTDTFVSMGKEAETEKRRKLFAPYQVNAKVLSYAKPDALVMHPLPAHRGEEISADVLDGPRSIVWEQAKNKLTIAKAVLLYLSEND